MEFSCDFDDISPFYDFFIVCIFLLHDLAREDNSPVFPIKIYENDPIFLYLLNFTDEPPLFWFAPVPIGTHHLLVSRMADEKSLNRVVEPEKIEK